MRSVANSAGVLARTAAAVGVSIAVVTAASARMEPSVESVRARRSATLRDLVARNAQEGGAETVGPDDTLDTAYKRMRTADVSQLGGSPGDLGHHPEAVEDVAR